MAGIAKSINLGDLDKKFKNLSEYSNDTQETWQGLNKLFDKIDKRLSSISSLGLEAGGRFDKLSKFASKMAGAFERAQQSLRLIKMSNLGKAFSMAGAAGGFMGGLAGGVLSGVSGVMSSISNALPNLVEGRLNDAFLARKGNTNIKMLRALEQASVLSGVDGLISKDTITSTRYNAMNIENAGALSMLGLDTGKVGSMDGVQLFLKISEGISKLLQSSGGWDEIAKNNIAQVTGLENLTGLNIQDMRAIDWKSFSQFLKERYNASNMNEGAQINFEREYKRFGFNLDNLKESALQTFLPAAQTSLNAIKNLLDKVYVWLTKNKVFEKLGDKLNDFVKNLDFDKIVDFITNDLPSYFRMIAIPMLHIGEFLTTGSTNKMLKQMRYSLEKENQAYEDLKKQRALKQIELQTEAYVKKNNLVKDSEGNYVRKETINIYVDGNKTKSVTTTMGQSSNATRIVK